MVRPTFGELLWISPDRTSGSNGVRDLLRTKPNVVVRAMDARWTVSVMGVGELLQTVLGYVWTAALAPGPTWELGVSQSTVSRDVTAIFRMVEGPVRCPFRGAVRPREKVRR